MLAVMSSFTSPVILDDSSSNSDTDDTHLVISDDSPTCIIVPDSPVKVVTTKQCRLAFNKLNRTVNCNAIIEKLWQK